MTSRSRCVLVVSIISICCISYFLLYLRLYIGYYNQLKSHHSVSPDRYVRGNGSAVAVTGTTTTHASSVKLNSINSGQHVSTFSFRTMRNRYSRDNSNGSTVAATDTTPHISMKSNSINSGQHVSSTGSRTMSKGSVTLAHSTLKPNQPVSQSSNKITSTAALIIGTTKTLNSSKPTNKPRNSTPSISSIIQLNNSKSVNRTLKMVNSTTLATSTKQANNSVSVTKPFMTTTHSTTISPTQNPFGSSKVILMWTQYYDESQWKLENDFSQILPMGKSYFESYCPQYDCYITTDKALYNNSDAIVFHDRNILYKNDKTMPSYRSPWQRWVFYNIESPRYVYSYQRYKYQTKNAIYNWSMTYRNNSHVDARYGYIVKRIKPTLSWMHTWSIDYHGHKKLQVAWLVSHCMNQRLQFVKALAKHIQVNIYGGCGNHHCQHKSNLDCWKYEIIQYKFYLAFENSVCTDYVTEKFWYPLRYGVIPVVLGGGQYRKIAPPNSYIDVGNFTSITALATYLHKVASSKTLYNSYMKWRQHWEVIIPRHWCNLCSSLYHHNSSSRHSYRTYNDDFGVKGVINNCQNYPVPKV